MDKNMKLSEEECQRQYDYFSRIRFFKKGKPHPMGSGDAMRMEAIRKGMSMYKAFNLELHKIENYNRRHKELEK